MGIRFSCLNIVLITMQEHKQLYGAARCDFQPKWDLLSSSWELEARQDILCGWKRINQTEFLQDLCWVLCPWLSSPARERGGRSEESWGRPQRKAKDWTISAMRKSRMWDISAWRNLRENLICCTTCTDQMPSFVVSDECNALSLKLLHSLWERLIFLRDYKVVN